MAIAMVVVDEMRKSFYFRSITNEGMPAKIRVWIWTDEDDKKSGVVICKTLFSTDANYFGVMRKWKNVYFCEEKIVLKFNTYLIIANEIVNCLNIGEASTLKDA